MNIIDNFIIPNTNIDYGDIINKLQHYMLTERLIESSIEHKIQKSKDE